MNKNKLYLVFDNLQTVHLSKDVGELISGSEDLTCFGASIVTSTDCQIANTYQAINIVNLKRVSLPRISIRFFVLYKIKSGDYLLLYHGGLINYILAFIIKFIKPKVKIILKLDFNDLIVQRFIHAPGIIEKVKSVLRQLLGGFIDLYIIETQKSFDLLKNLSPFKSSIALIPNGISAIKAYGWDVIKEDLIVVVGRIGASEKNHELLLKAFASSKNLQGYKLYFVGPVKANFKRFYEDLCFANPTLKEMVYFTGNIENKEDLNHYYKRAKIVAFSSYYEGFSIAMIEAMYFGCYLISTDLAVAFDLTLNGIHGKIVPINSQLLSKMEKDGVVDYVKYIHANQDEINHSSWFENSVDLYASTLDEVISHSFDISNARENSQRIFNEYNWPKIRKVFNETIR
jgi:glycosyltransferase involved in cell wall biosynthesis